MKRQTDRNCSFAVATVLCFPWTLYKRGDGILGMYKKIQISSRKYKFLFAAFKEESTNIYVLFSTQEKYSLNEKKNRMYTFSEVEQMA